MTSSPTAPSPADFGFRVTSRLDDGPGLGRAGVIRTPHGEIETPAFIVVGTKATVKAVLPALRERKGHLLLTGSAAGRRHLKGSVYGATKWFVQGYAGNIAEEMADWGGRVTLLTPGLVDTPFFSTPKPGAIRPEDVAAAALFALESAPTAVMGEIHIRPAP